MKKSIKQYKYLFLLFITVIILIAYIILKEGIILKMVEVIKIWKQMKQMEIILL
jgi:hypothetical protein